MQPVSQPTSPTISGSERQIDTFMLLLTLMTAYASDDEVEAALVKVNSILPQNEKFHLETIFNWYAQIIAAHEKVMLAIIDANAASDEHLLYQLLEQLRVLHGKMFADVSLEISKE